PQNIEAQAHAWVTLADIDNYAFAITDQKIIAALKQEMGLIN
ncbi:MAG: 8-oxo-dGTP diphosphatase MutT, partial [Candidatus Thermofonsia bacterium]